MRSRHSYMDLMAVDGAHVGNHENRCDTEADHHRDHDEDQMLVDALQVQAIQGRPTDMVSAP